MKTTRTVKHNNNRSNREKSLHRVALVAMVSGSQQTMVLQRKAKRLTDDFPLHDYPGEKNGSPYSFPSFDNATGLSRKIVVIQKFCYHGKFARAAPLFVHFFALVLHDVTL